MPNLLNAGVDVNHYRPVMFPELVRNNEIFKKSARRLSFSGTILC
jgi:hypothetical protein